MNDKMFEVKEKTFFLVSQALLFTLTKQTSNNVADTTFQCFIIVNYAASFYRTQVQLV